MLTRWLAPLLLLTSALGVAAQAPATPGFAPPKVPAATETDPQADPPAPAESELTSPEEDSRPAKKFVLPKLPNAKSPAFFGPETVPYTIPLQEALRQALKNNLEARVEEAGISLEEARYRNATGVFDPVLSASLGRSLTRTPDSRQNITSADAVAQLQAIEAQIAAINANTQQNEAFTQAIIQALNRPAQQFNTTPLTSETPTGVQRIIFEQASDKGQISLQARSPIGTVLQASAGVSKLVSTFQGDTRDLTNLYSFTGTLEARQPLLKDFGFAANLADIRIARKNQKAQEYVWRLTLERQLQHVISDYYDMIFGLNDMTNKGDAIIAGLRLVAFSQRRKDLGFLADYQVQQAQVQLAADRESLLVAKANFLRFQYVMKALILPGYDMSDRRVLLPAQIPSLKVPKLDRGPLLALAFERRLDYKSALLAAEAEEVRLKFARNQTYPQLDVVGSYGWAGLDSSYPSAIGQSTEGQADSWSLGLQFSMPLGGVQPRSQLLAAKARKEQAILNVAKAERDVGLSVDQAIDLIRTNQQRLEYAHDAAKIAELAVRTGLRLTEEGLSSNFELIDQQRRLYDARTRELSAIAELNKSITELWFSTGTLLENLNITAPTPTRVTTGRPNPRPADYDNAPVAKRVNRG